MQKDTLEFVAAVATAVAHLSTVRLGGAAGPVIHGVFVGAAVLGWLIYIAWSVRKDPERVRLWGFTTKNLRQSALATGLFVALSAVGIAGIGVATGHALSWRWTYTVSLLLYPLWGLIQQLLVNGVLARNLKRRWGTVPAVVVSATLFGLIHMPHANMPHPELMFATFGLGLVLTPLYFKYGNLWPLAVAHGWLGALIYPWVLGVDPVANMLGM